MKFYFIFLIIGVALHISSYPLMGMRMYNIFPYNEDWRWEQGINIGTSELADMRILSADGRMILQANANMGECLPFVSLIYT